MSDCVCLRASGIRFHVRSRRYVETPAVDSSLYRAAAEDLDEANHLRCVLNSDALRAGVARYRPQEQWGARYFDK